MKKSILICTALVGFNLSVIAQTIPLADKPVLTMPAPPAISVNAKSWVLMAYRSGQIIAGKDIYKHLPPASLTKLMSSYVLSQAIESGKVKLSDKVKISTKAWQTGGSKTFVREGTKVSVEDLMKGMIIQSGNDATTALAEHLAGSSSNFAQMMNHTAQSLGMNNSHFGNANGLPAKGQYSSAYDLAILSRALIAHFPQEYSWYKQKSFTFNGIKQRNRNRLLWQDPDVDGLKTGYTKAAGYCLVASGEKNGKRYIAVVLGAATPIARTAEAKKLLGYGFSFYQTKKLFTQNQTLEQIEIPKTAGQHLKVTIKNTVYVTVPKGQEGQVKAHLAIKPNLKAPIKAGTQIGKLVVNFGDETLETQPLYSQNTVEPAGFFKRAAHSVKGWF